MKQRAEEMYMRSLAGETYPIIAKDFGITPQRVGQIIREYEIQTGRRKARTAVSEHHLAIWRSLAQSGITQAQIAKQFGYSQKSVSRALKRKTPG